MLASNSAVVFAILEHGFHRLYYFGASEEAIAEVLAAFPAERNAVIGYVDKIINRNLCSVFLEAGFYENAHYQRMVNLKLPVRRTRTEPEFSRVDETESLMRLLNETFNPMTDHLPELERLRDIVAAEQAIVIRTDGQITGALVFQQRGKQVNFNFLVNRSGNTLDLLSMQNSFYQAMAARGVTSGFLWVDKRNTGVIKLHQAFGWKFDNLNDWFYIRLAI